MILTPGAGCQPSRARTGLKIAPATAATSGNSPLPGVRAHSHRSASRKSTTAFGSSASCYSDLGYFDLEQKTLQPLDNPFGTRLSPMS
jgi:hypothetical protein